MNDMIENKIQTPIEIALGIDENGMTTASKLYSFLELSQSNYSKWCRTNIIDNEFAEENIDFVRFVIEYESGVGVKEREDFKLTAHFAKKLSVKGNSVKAEEAREYFTRVEERAKQLVVDRTQLSPQLQLMNLLVENMNKQELEQKRQAEALQRLEDKTNKQTEALQTVKDTFSKSETEEETVQWVNHCINKIAKSPNFVYSFGNRYAAAKNESYNRLSTKAGCRLDQKLRNSIARAEERGYTRAQINTINKLSVIMADKRLKQIYIGVIKEMMIAYCVEIA